MTYILVEVRFMICEKCGKEFEKDYRKHPKGEPRFCSIECANSRKHSDETIKKIRENVLSYMNKNGIKHKPKTEKVYKKKEKFFCKSCGVLLSRKNKTGYCKLCCNKFKPNGEEELREKYIKEWLESGELKTNSAPRKRVRNYILKEQNGLCDTCGLKQEWNGKKLIFVLDHIDGNNKNNKRENLRMICPNCDSQLDTFKSKNKGKGREYDNKYRLEYYHKNK